MKPLIGLTMRVCLSTDHGGARDAISHDWERFLNDLGVTPVLIPNTLQDPAAFVESVGIQALLLTGGGDVSPQPAERLLPSPQTHLEELRDSTEHALLKLAVRSGMPVLGVCRGMQAINVFFGGKLVRDLRAVGSFRSAHVGTCHEIELVDPKYRLRLGAGPLSTNSFHRHAVSLLGLSSKLRAFALAPDRIVEGLYHPDLPIAGVQWHPERPRSASRLDRELFEDWLSNMVLTCTSSY